MRNVAMGTQVDRASKLTPACEELQVDRGSWLADTTQRVQVKQFSVLDIFIALALFLMILLFRPQQLRTIHPSSWVGQTDIIGSTGMSDLHITSVHNGSLEENASVVSNFTPTVVQHVEGLPGRRELDIIVAAYDEDPGTTLRHIETCCSPETCQVFIYLSKSGDSQRSHSQPASQSHYTAEDWQEFRTPFNKLVIPVDNSWTGTESTGFMTHIVERFSNLSKALAFVHGHITSWHSDSLCDIINNGMNVLRSRKAWAEDAVYVNLNKPYPRRCLSPSGFSGIYATHALRDKVYSNWTKWTGAPVPRRVSWECCAQFLTTQHSIHVRPLAFWERALHTMKESASLVWDEIPWEYLWPTMIDEQGTFELSSC